MKFKLEEYNRNVSDEELIKDLQKVAIKLNKKVAAQQEYDLLRNYSGSTLFRRFGNWFRALEKTRTPMNISEKELFENLEEI